MKGRDNMDCEYSRILEAKSGNVLWCEKFNGKCSDVKNCPHKEAKTEDDYDTDIDEWLKT